MIRPAPLLAPEATARRIWDFMLANGASKAGAAGLLGNIQQECSFNNYEIESNGEGVGLAQWSFSRKKEFMTAATAANIDWRDLDFQLGYMLAELKKYPKTWRQITTAADPYAAAIAICNDYEQPQDTPDYIIQHRAIPAQQWYEKFVGTPTVKLPTVSLGALLRHDPTAVRMVQAALNKLIKSGKMNGTPLVLDGVWTPNSRTQAAYNHFRVEVMGLSTQAAQGTPGSQSLVALGQAAGFNAVR